MYRSRKETRRRARNDEKKNTKRHGREKEGTAREREESSRDTLTGSLTATFGSSGVTKGGLTFGKLCFFVIDREND